MIPIGKVEIGDGWALLYANGFAYVTPGGALACCDRIVGVDDLAWRHIAYRTDRIGD